MSLCHMTALDGATEKNECTIAKYYTWPYFLYPEVSVLQQFLPLERVRSLVKIAQKLLPFLVGAPQVEALQSMRE